MESFISNALEKAIVEDIGEIQVPRGSVDNETDVHVHVDEVHVGSVDV